MLPFMKLKFNAIVLVCFMWTCAVFAAAPILVYQSGDHVKNGSFVLGSSTGSYVLVPADAALAAKMEPLVGEVGGALYHSTLFRLDNELRVALLKPTEVVVDEKLKNHHQLNSTKMAAFLPQEQISVDMFAPLPPTEPFQIKINGQLVEEGPLMLQVKRKKANIDLEIIQLSTGTSWRIEFNLQSEPRLFFWQRNKTRGLNQIPQAKLVYEYQVLFKPIAAGGSIKIPIEVSGIKESAYTWTAHVESKDVRFEKKISVEFKP